MQILEMNGIHGGTLATVIIISDGYCTKKVYYWKPTSSFKSVYIFKQIKTHPQKAQLTVALPRLMSASLWSISTFSTPDSFNLMFSGHCRMLLSSARHRHILICLTNHSLLFLISVRLVNPCCWKAIAPFGKKLSASPPPSFFSSKWNAHFQLTQTIPETYPIGTQRPTHIQPCDPSAGLQEWDVVSAFLSLTPQREALAKTWRSPDARQCLPEKWKHPKYLLY